MELRTLGASGTLVSVYALGTMTFGLETDEPDAQAILDRYVAAGGNLIDTADVYGPEAASEAIIGRWLAGRGDRDDLVIATKGRFPVQGGPSGPNRFGASAVHLRRAVDDSLRRLQVDHLDLYQVHAWDPLTPIEETLGVLSDLVLAGKIRYVGVSNFTGWQLQRTTLVARYEGYRPVVTLQPQWNLLARQLEWELIPLCADEGIGVLPWSPLGGGWLTGKYSRDERPSGESRLGDDPDRGVEAYDKRNTDRTWAILDVVGEVADDRGVAMTEVALNWLRAQPTVSSVILGVRTLEQLDSNLEAATWQLTADEVARLDDVSAPPTPDYPYGFLAEQVQPRWDLLG